MPSVDYKAARGLVSMWEVLDLLGWKPTTATGPMKRGGCPVHRGKSPKPDYFCAWSEGYACHVCGSKGNALDLYAAAVKLPLYDGTRELFNRLGKRCPFLPRRSIRGALRRPPANRDEDSVGGRGGNPRISPDGAA
jgi:hypothetical protein